MAIASLIVSIIAIILSIIPVVGLPIALIALILAIIAMCRKKNKEVYRGLKIAGLVISIISFVISILMSATTILLTFGIINAGKDMVEDIVNNGNQMIEDATSELEEIAGSLKNDVVNSYDGKVKTGAEILASIRNFEKSESISLIVTTEEGTYNIGAGIISLPIGITIDDYKQGGIANATIKKGATSSYSEVSSKILTNRYYNTALVYNHSSKLIGIAIIDSSIKASSDNNKTEQETDKQPEKVDVYANYKNITWSDKSSNNTKISNNKLYFNNKEVKTGISGTLKSVETIMVGGFPYIYLLTEDGKAWYIVLDDIVNNSVSSKKQLLSNYKILDITILKTYTNKYSDSTVYFLTSDGKLIDENNVSYNKYNFVSSLLDSSQTGYIPFDKNGYGYYYNESKNTYSVIVSKSNGAKLTFSKVYAVGSKLLIQTAYNKLFEYTWTGDKATEVSGTVTSIKKTKNGDLINLVIIFDDGTTKTYNNATYGWNIKTNKEIALNSLADYESVKIEIEGAISELESISGALLGQVIDDYSGKTKSGSEILAAIRKYSDSNSVSMIITDGSNKWHVGAGIITLPNGLIKNDYLLGRINNSKVSHGTTTSYNDMVGNISTNSYYYTAVVYDANENVIGIAVIKR